jgi:rubrerythrin
MDEMMDINKDEIRRHLRESDRENRAALPAFADALDHALDPDNRVAAADKAALLGLPDRRGFLKIGGMSVALSALAVACVYPDKEKTQLANTGSFAPAPSTSVPENPGSALVDATLVLTAISIERLAIDTYEAALKAGWLDLAILKEVATYFHDQHRDHAGVLESFARQLGQDGAAVKANEFLKKEVVDVAVDAISKEQGSKAQAQTDTLKLAMSLEDAAAQTYAKAGGILTTKVMRQGIMSIGSIEAKHVSLFASVLQQQIVPFSFEHTNGAAPEDSYVKPNQATIPTTTAETPSPTTSAASRPSGSGLGGVGLGGSAGTTVGTTR